MATYVSDTFERTVSSGWGTADTGGSWTTSWGPDTSVSSGKGRLSLPNNGSLVTVSIPGTSSVADAQATVRVSSNKIFTSTNAWAEVRLRKQSGADTSYLVRFNWLSDESITLGLYRRSAGSVFTVTADTTVSGLTNVADREFWVKFQVEGTNLRARAWEYGTSEPSTWAVTGTDSNITAAGSYQTHAQVSGTEAPTISFDDLTIEDITTALTVSPAVLGGGSVFSPTVTGGDIAVFPDVLGGGSVFACQVIGGGTGYGGDPSTRGVKSFTPLACTTTVSGFTAAAVHTARDAAGPDGVVCFPAGTYSGNLTANVAGQRWQLDPASILTGGVSVDAQRVTLIGGQIARNTTNTFDSGVALNANDCRVENVAFTTGGGGVSINHVNRCVVTNCEFTNRSSMAVMVWANGSVNADDNQVLNNIIRAPRAGLTFTGAGISAIIARGDETSPYTTFVRRLIVRNNYVDQGLGRNGGGPGWFGIELARTTDAIIEDNETHGGEAHISLPEGDRAIVRRNKIDFSTYSSSYWGVEVANADDVQVTNNWFFGRASGTKIAVNQNTNPDRTTITFNRGETLSAFVELSGQGHTITDNCLSSVTATTTGTATNTTIARNGPSEGPCAAGTQSVSPGLISNLGTVLAPTVTGTATSVSLDIPLIPSNTTLFVPSLTPEGVGRSDLPVQTTKIDWDNNGRFELPYELVSGDVLGLEYSRGASDDYGGVAVGQAVITLRNDHDRYTPERNIVDNPSFEVDTADWSTTAVASLTAAATSITRITTDFATDGGEASGEVILTGTLNSGVTHALPGRFLRDVPYSCSVSLRSISGNRNIEMGVASSGTPADRGALTVVANTDWTRYTFTWTPTATRSDAVFYVRTTTAATATLRLDTLQVNAGPTANDYIEAPTLGQLVPGHKVHVFATYSGRDYALFFGTIERLSPDPVNRTMRVYCQDAFASMQSTPITIPSAQIPRSHGELRALALQAWAAGTQRTSFSDSAYNLAHAAASFESPALGTPAHVQTKSGSSTGDTTSHSIKLDAATGAGSLLAIAVGTSAPVTLSVSTDASPAPQLVQSQTSSGGSVAAQLWYVYPTAGAQRITVSATAPVRIGIIASEYTGVYPDITAHPDRGYAQKWSANAGPATSASGAAANKSLWPDFIVSMEVHDDTSRSTTSPAGYNQRASITPASGFVMSTQDRYRAPADETAAAPTNFTYSGSTHFALVGMVFGKVQPFRASGCSVVQPAVANQRTTSTAKYGSASYEFTSIKPTVESTSTVAGAGSGFTITKPSGTVDGDVLIAVAAASVADGWTPPAGWTSIAAVSSGPSVAAWYRVASGEGANYTFTSGNTNRVAAAMLRLSGVNTGGVVNVSATTSGAIGTGRSVTIPSAVITETNEMVFAFLTTDDGTPPDGTLYVPGSDFFSHLLSVDADVGGTEAALGILYGATGATMTTGSRYATYQGPAANNFASIFVAINDTGGAATTSKSGVWLPVGAPYNGAASELFNLEKTYTWTAWVKAASGTVTGTFGSDSQSRGTDSVDTITGDGTFQMMSGTWTPGGVGEVSDVHLHLHSSAGIGVQVDGIVVVEGPTAIAFEEQTSDTVGHWTLPTGETGLARADYEVSSDALSVLRDLNAVTGSTHAVRPLLVAPYFEYVGTSRTTWQAKAVADVIEEGITDMSVSDIDRDAIHNVVRLTSTDFEVVRSNAASLARYKTRLKEVRGGGLYAETTTPAAVGDYYLTRDQETRLRPTVTMVNKWPAQLERNPEDLIQLTFGRLGIYNRRFVIASIRVRVSRGGALWETTWALEEFPF